MALWQRPVRIGLLSFAIAFGIAVILGIQQRPPTEVYDRLSRVDSDAVIQSRGARIEQIENTTESLSVEANTQLAYPDGSVKLIGEVRIETTGGLLATTEEASYSEDEAFVRMPFSTEFRRSNLLARADSASYDRENDIVYLEPNAFVELLNDNVTSRVRINSRSAVVAQDDGYMKFSGGTTINVNMNKLSGTEILTTLNPNDNTRLDAIEISGNGHISRSSDANNDSNELSAPEINVRYGELAIERAELRGGATVSGESNELSAQEIRVSYGEDVIERAELRGGATVTGKQNIAGHLESLDAPEIDVNYKEQALDTLSMAGGSTVSMYGDDGDQGAVIEAGSIDIKLNQNNNTFKTIEALDSVTVNFPSRDSANQKITAQSFSMFTDSGISTQDGSDVIRAEFRGPVEYLESQDKNDQDHVDRLIQSESLRADIQPGFMGLRKATFERDVKLLSGDTVGEASAAVYDVQAGTFGLHAPDPNSTKPRITDKRGTLEATNITLDFSGPNVNAIGDIKGVLDSPATPTNDQESGENSPKRPALLEQGPPIYVVAGRFDYDTATFLATYSEAARLWQKSTEFSADTLILNESTGNVTAEGNVTTQITMLQQDYETGSQIQTITRGSGNSFIYDESQRRAAYSGGSSLSNDTFTLNASSINVILEGDGQTLERIEASDGVELELDARWVTGASLTYFDADGRYEMNGNPVNIVEETEGECRSTTGRTIIFYVTAESVLIDGESEVRTASTNGTCDALKAE